MKKPLPFLFAAVLFMSGCGSSVSKDETAPKDSLIVLDLFDQEGSPSYDVDTRRLKVDFHKSVESRNIKCSEIFDSLWYVQLETRDDCLIGRVFDLTYTGKEFIVCDRNQIYRFSSDGKLLNRIGHVGRGPREYIYAFHAGVIGSGDDGLAFISSGQGKMHVFKLNGEFVKSFPYENYAYTFDPVDTAHIVSTEHPHVGTGNPYCVLVRDTKGDTVMKQPAYLSYPQPAANSSFSVFDGHIYKYEDTTYVQVKYVDTVFRLSENRLKPHYVLDLGKYKIPDDWVPESGNISYEKLQKEVFRFLTPCLIQETDGYIFAKIVSNNNLSYYFVYDKMTGKLSVADPVEKNCGGVAGYIPGLKNDMDGGLPFEPDFMSEQYMIENIQLGKMEALEKYEDDILDSTYTDTGMRKRLLEVIDNFDENNNMLILVGRIKK